MKVLQVHNYYQQKGGEDAVVENEKLLLRDAGHEVIQYVIHNNQIDGLIGKINTALNSAYSRNSYRRFLRCLKDARPDIVHVHNFFPLITPAIFDSCKKLDIPSVMTLHNYRLICPGAFLMRDGNICEDCLNDSAYRAIARRCYRDSYLATLTVAHMVEYHRKRRTWKSRVDAFIALTHFSKKKFIEGGLPADRIYVKPNFVCPPSDTSIDTDERCGFLYVGRLSREKGVLTLLEAWRDLDYPLRIVGDGPLRDIVERVSISKVKYLGSLSQDDVFAEMVRSQALIMPSEWYEGFPMVLVEAMSRGLPVIGSNIGAMAEVVQDGVTGMHFESGNVESLREAVCRMARDKETLKRMSEESMKIYREKYSPEVNLCQLMDIYERAKQVS